MIKSKSIFKKPKNIFEDYEQKELLYFIKLGFWTAIFIAIFLFVILLICKQPFIFAIKTSGMTAFWLTIINILSVCIKSQNELNMEKKKLQIME